MTTGPASPELSAITALQSEFARPRPARDSLQTAVCTYVDELKREGAAVERVILDLKQIAACEESFVRRALRSPQSGELDEARLLLEDTVKWSIERYYGTTVVKAGSRAAC